ncbi:MAG: hypothetical protein IKZ90_08790 [Clostridiales bacterium]|nr:hypothetical protein [Clostridiales bacterium]
MKHVMKKATALILSAMMTAGIFVTAIPKKEATVNAASGNKTVAFGENMKTILKTNANTGDSARVYYGFLDSPVNPLDWNVVGFDDTGVGRGSNKGCATLFSRHCLGQSKYANFISGTYNYAYVNSILKTYVDALVDNGTMYSEREAISERAGIGKYWPLNVYEASLLDFSLRRINYGNGVTMPLSWGLREQNSGTQSTYIMLDDAIAQIDVEVSMFVRPAFNLDLSKVAFISAAEGGKPDKDIGLGNMVNIDNYSGNEWKLTVINRPTNSFTAKLENTGTIFAGDAVNISYANAFTGSNDFVSVIIADKNGNALKYGYIAHSSNSGLASLTIPKDLPTGEYTFKVFTENRQPDKRTDTCSNVVDLKVTVLPQNADVKIDLSSGSASPDNLYIVALGTLWTENLISGTFDDEKIYYDLDKDGHVDIVYHYYGTMSLKKSAESSVTGKITFSGSSLAGTGYGSITIILPVNKPGTVKGLKAASAGKNKVELTWNPVDGVEGYLIYAQKNNQYGYVGMTKNTKFTDTKALDTDYNYYWVFGYTRDTQKNMVPGGCEKYVYAKGVCLAVTGLKASSVTGGVKLSWNASSGAEGYLIYGIHPGGSYEYIGMTTSGTTYTDKNASKTDWNYYWVYPYHKNGSTMVVGGTPKYVYGRAK